MSKHTTRPTPGWDENHQHNQLLQNQHNQQLQQNQPQQQQQKLQHNQQPQQSPQQQTTKKVFLHKLSANDLTTLAETAQQKRQEGAQILEKLNKFKKATKDHSKENKQKQHRFDWLQEHAKLSEERKALEQELDRILWKLANEEASQLPLPSPPSSPSPPTTLPPSPSSLGAPQSPFASSSLPSSSSSTPRTPQHIQLPAVGSPRQQHSNTTTQSPRRTPRSARQSPRQLIYTSSASMMTSSPSSLLKATQQPTFFAEIVQEHSERSIQRQKVAEELMEQIRDLQIYVHTVKLDVKSKPSKNLSNSSKEKFQKEFGSKLTAFKNAQSAAVAELAKSEQKLESTLATLRQQIENPDFISQLTITPALFTPKHTPSATPRTARSTPRSARSIRSTSSPSGLSVITSPAFDTFSNFTDSSVLTTGSYLQQIDMIPCADMQLTETLHADWNRMEMKFQAQISELKSKFIAEHHTTDLKTGGWDEKSHTHFMSIFALFAKKGSGGRKEEIVERAIVEMPDKTAQEIEDHLEWVRAQQLYRTKHKALKNTWARERGVWFEHSKELIEEANELATYKIEKESEQELYEKKKEYFQTKLTVWREERAKAVAYEMELDQMDREAIKEREKQQKEIESKEREAKKQQLKKYKEDLQLHKEKQQEEEALRQDQLLKEKRELDKVNIERTEFRQQQLEKKTQENVQKKLELEKLEKLKEMQLDKLRDTVRIDVPRDPERVLQGTKASAAVTKTLPPLFSNPGYTDEDITSDKRYRVEMALKNAGLLHTKYAQEALANIPTKVRMDQLSSDQKESYLKRHNSSVL